MQKPLHTLAFLHLLYSAVESVLNFAHVSQQPCWSLRISRYDGTNFPGLSLPLSSHIKPLHAQKSWLSHTLCKESLIRISGMLLSCVLMNQQFHRLVTQKIWRVAHFMVADVAETHALVA